VISEFILGCLKAQVIVVLCNQNTDANKCKFNIW
jgi:hypothetical protein